MKTNVRKLLLLPMLFLHSMSLNAASDAEQPKPQPIKWEFIRLLERSEIIQYLERPSGEDFPQDASGVEKSFPEVPGFKYKLVAILDTTGGPQAASIPWNFNSPIVHVDWSSIESAFGIEMKKAHFPVHIPVVTQDGGDPKKPSDKPIVPGSAQKALSHDQVKEIGKVTSIIFVMYPNEVTAAVAVVADSAVLLDEAFGSHGLVVGYNPFVGMSYVVPTDLEPLAHKISDSVVASAEKFGKQGVGAPISATLDLAKTLKDKHFSPEELKRNLIPMITSGVPITPNEVKEIAKKADEAKNKIGSEVNKQEQKVEGVVTKQEKKVENYLKSKFGKK